MSESKVNILSQLLSTYGNVNITLTDPNNAKNKISGRWDKITIDKLDKFQSILNMSVANGEWKPIPQFSHYVANEQGIVRKIVFSRKGTKIIAISAKKGVALTRDDGIRVWLHVDTIKELIGTKNMPKTVKAKKVKIKKLTKKERWIPIEGWSFYEISTWLRLRSLDRVVIRNNHKYRIPGKMLLAKDYIHIAEKENNKIYCVLRGKLNKAFMSAFEANPNMTSFKLPTYFKSTTK